VILSGLISSREKYVISSSVNSFGSVLLMPNFFNRFNIEGENSRFPFVVGTRWLYKALTLCVASRNMLLSIAAAIRLSFKLRVSRHTQQIIRSSDCMEVADTM
jgi:hypothetical protein